MKERSIFHPQSFAVVGAGPVGCIVAAFLSKGGYDVTLCEPEMQRNRHTPITVEGEAVRMDGLCDVVKFCRACELACPVAVSKRNGDRRTETGNRRRETGRR